MDGGGASLHFVRWGHARWSMWRRSEVSAARRTRGHTVEDRDRAASKERINSTIRGGRESECGEVQQVEQSPERLLCVKFV